MQSVLGDHHASNHKVIYNIIISSELKAVDRSVFARETLYDPHEFSSDGGGSRGLSLSKRWERCDDKDRHHFFLVACTVIHVKQHIVDSRQTAGNGVMNRLVIIIQEAA